MFLMNNFNVRVYGLLINAEGQILVSDEREYGMEFTKFPGGGLEYGEGLREGLEREFREECQVGIEIIRHIHTTDFFVKSAFGDSQVIGVYYLVKTAERPRCRFSSRRFDFLERAETDQVFRWLPIADLAEHDLTFEIDRAAWRVFMSEKSHGLKFLT